MDNVTVVAVLDGREDLPELPSRHGLAHAAVAGDVVW